MGPNPRSSSERSADSSGEKVRWTLVGALAGALVAGGFSLAATELQQQREAERSEADFLRAERLQAYGSYLDGWKNFDSAMHELSGAFLPAAINGQVPDTSTALAAAIDARESFSADLSIVSLICQQEVCDAASAAYDAQVSAFRDLLEGTSDPAITSSGYEAALEEFASTVAPRSSARQSFINAVKREFSG